jgi:hypothetical protein
MKRRRGSLLNRCTLLKTGFWRSLRLYWSKASMTFAKLTDRPTWIDCKPTRSCARGSISWIWQELISSFMCTILKNKEPSSWDLKLKNLIWILLSMKRLRKISCMTTDWKQKHL